MPLPAQIPSHRHRAIAWLGAFVALATLHPAAAQGRFVNFTPETPPEALGQSPVFEGKPRVLTRLLADVAVAQPGDVFHVGVLFDLDPGWHIYWVNPGDAGFPTELRWRAGDATVGPVAYPAPAVFRESDGITTYGYQDRVLLAAQAMVSDSAALALDLEVEVRYLACNVICSPGQVTLRRRLPLGRAAVPADPEIDALFRAAEAAVPRPIDPNDVAVQALFSQNVVRPGDHFEVALLLDGCGPHPPEQGCPPPLCAPGQPFAAYMHPGLKLRAAECRAHPTLAHGLAVVLEGELDAAGTANEAPPSSLRGVLQLSRAGAELRPVEVEIPLPLAAAGTPVVAQHNSVFEAPRAAPMAPAPPPRAASALFEALGLALLGGMILNLMPCVLPVLAIKVIGMAHLAGSRRRTVALHGLSYTAGVVGSMLLLGGVVLLLGALGTQVGWGFQFQEPRFVAAVSCVLVLFALNCFGVYEIYSGAGALGQAVAAAQGLRRSVLDGVLAVVLSTPCSAPVLGPAVAYALSAAWWVNLLTFACIGVGLAAPYVALTLTPGLVSRLPRPGAWMAQVKACLGFGLLGTTVWLLWIFGRARGVDAASALWLFLLLMSFGAWIYGLLVQRQPHRQGWLATLFLGLLVVGFAAGLRPGSGPAPAAAERSGGLAYAPWSAAAVRQALSDGHPVFVDFSADWCITCKFNESHVLQDAAVQSAFAARHVALFQADWTTRDDAILKVLQSFGHAGVPMYLLYDAQAPQAPPQVLPEILTAETVLAALRALKGSGPTQSP